jgi:hypothetical protein
MPFPNSLLNREKFPVLREFRVRRDRQIARMAAPDLASSRCFHDLELRNLNNLVLISFSYACVRERASADADKRVPRSLGTET